MNSKRIILAGCLGIAGVVSMAHYLVRTRPPAPSPEVTKSAVLPAPRANHETTFQERTGRIDELPKPDGKGVGESTKAAFFRGLSAALNSIQAERDDQKREDQLSKLARDVPGSELSAAVEFLSEHATSEWVRDLRLRLIRRWAGDDSVAAAQWVASHVQEAGRQEAINAISVIWANKDVTAAVEWVLRLPEPEERQGGLLSAGYEVARSEPVEAIKLALTMPASELRDDFIAHSVAQWAAASPARAAEWAGNIADTTFRERLLAEIARSWAEQDPNAAATMALKSLSPGRQQDDAVMGIVQHLAQSNPDQAAAWIVQFPDGSLRETALEELIKLWADRDLDQAGKWLHSQKLEPNYDTGIRAYVSKLTPLDPQLAVQWAANINDEELRAREMEAVGEAWMISDAVAARAWIVQSPLNGTAKDRLLALKAR